MRRSFEKPDQMVEGSIAVSLMGERGLVSNRANDGQYGRLRFGAKLHQALATRWKS